MLRAAGDGILYPTSVHPRRIWLTAQRTLQAPATDWNAPGRRARHRVIIICVVIVGRAIELSSASRFSKLIFFPGSNHRAKTPIQSRRVLATAALVGKTSHPPSARITRFIHSTPRPCIATQTPESPATATVLAKPYTRHTMPIVHSARNRALFSELSRRDGWTR
jgi:hypothetical protein